MKANYFLIALATLTLTMVGCKKNETNFDYSADITLADLEEEARAYEFVDLGCTIQRGDATYRILWATANVADAYEVFNNPSDWGGYYAWAENSEKDEETPYNWQKYKYINKASIPSFKKYTLISSKLDLAELEVKDDAANYNWEFDVRTPSMDCWKWLVENCRWEWTSLNGATGYAVTGKTGKSIFLPAAGLKSAENHVNKGTTGCYMSRDLEDPISDRYTHAKCLSFNSTHRTLGNQIRSMGISVRAVYELKLVEE